MKERVLSLRPPTPEELAGARVLVLGLGRAGSSAARFLLKKGARVTGYDEEQARFDSPAVRRLVKSGLRPWQPRREASFDWAVCSPGLGDDNSMVKLLRRRGVPLVDELDLAALFLPGPLIAVTGTNGKSTTTVLIARMIAAAAKTVFFGGNLSPGRPLSQALLEPAREYYVAEASSFQLERARWLKPGVAVVLNVTPDHLNRHRTMARYARAKLRILDRQTSEDIAILNRDDPRVFAARSRGRGRKQLFSEKHHGAAWLEGGWLVVPDLGRIVEVARVGLRGRHNLQNALAATAAARALGIGARPIARVLRTFKGLPHRLELVRCLRGVEYLNNSMCTNPAAGARSVEAFGSQPVVLIAGGRSKGLPMGDYVRAICRHASWAILIGESQHELSRQLSRRGFRRFETASAIRDAVRAAQQRAVEGGVVLFAPGFASFDQFRDFQHRGEAFRREVKRLG